MKQEGRYQGIEDGQTRDSQFVDAKVPFGNGHGYDHVSHCDNEQGSPKETKQQVPATLFDEVIKFVDSYSHFSSLEVDRVTASANASQTG
jgi:hypothetical protein